MANLNITSGLREISRRLEEAAAIAKGAVACAEGGSEREALRIAMELDELSARRQPCPAPSACSVACAPTRASAMDVKVTPPEWIATGSITVRLGELNPHATEALIETLRDATEEDDARIRLLLDLWDSLTGG